MRHLLAPDSATIARLVRMALDEDAPWGDVTSQTLIAADARVTAHLVARTAGVLSGMGVFACAMSLTDPEIVIRPDIADGEAFGQGALLATVEGPARGILQAERVALNFVQRLSGIATLTASYVAQTGGTKARIVDTRKTTPGLRVLERYAVRCGGGHNHRFSLSDAALVKDNHLAIVMGASRSSLTEALLEMRRELPHTVHLEVEVDRADQIEPVLAAGVDTIMLDNFSTEAMRSAVLQIAGRALIEASGGITLARIAEIAATGVDIISAGALTHSAPWLDLALDIL